MIILAKQLASPEFTKLEFEAEPQKWGWISLTPEHWDKREHMKHSLLKGRLLSDLLRLINLKRPMRFGLSGKEELRQSKAIWRSPNIRIRKTQSNTVVVER